MGGLSRHSKPTDALVMLERCHERLVENIAVLMSAAARWRRTRDSVALEDARAVSRFLERAGRRHEADEEDSVFPRLPRSARLDQVIRVLAAEHRDHDREITHLADLVGSKPDPDELSRCAARLQSAYLAHIALEDAEIKPQLRRLSHEALGDILDEMQARRGR